MYQPHSLSQFNSIFISFSLAFSLLLSYRNVPSHDSANQRAYKHTKQTYQRNSISTPKRRLHFVRHGANDSTVIEKQEPPPTV